MKKNYKLLMQAKEINKFFKKSSNLDIYDSNAMKSQLQVTWKEITYEDLEIMEVTIQNDINKNNSILSLFGTTYGFIISLTVGFTGALVGIAATSPDESYKSEVLEFVGGFMIIFLVLVSLSFFHSMLSPIRYNKLLTTIRILKDIKESEQNK